MANSLRNARQSATLQALLKCLENDNPLNQISACAASWKLESTYLPIESMLNIISGISSAASSLAVFAIVAWLITGPLFDFSNTWQLVINTGTTIVTFLMVFLIQRAQNKDALAIQLKLNEIVACLQGASNRLIDIEGLSERELETLHRHYQQLSALSKQQHDLFSSHSVDEAERRHLKKIESST